MKLSGLELLNYIVILYSSSRTLHLDRGLCIRLVLLQNQCLVAALTQRFNGHPLASDIFL